jgi:hypothetical protein
MARLPDMSLSKDASNLISPANKTDASMRRGYAKIPFFALFLGGIVFWPLPYASSLFASMSLDDIKSDFLSDLGKFLIISSTIMVNLLVLAPLLWSEWFKRANKKEHYIGFIVIWICLVLVGFVWLRFFDGRLQTIPLYLFIQFFAVIPAGLASILFGSLSFAVLTHFNLNSFSWAATLGAVMGLLPTGLVLIWVIIESRGPPSAEAIAGNMAFWCSGGGLVVPFAWACRMFADRSVSKRNGL